MTPQDLESLRSAKALLEGKSLAMTIAAKVGMPLESLMRLLPARAQESIGQAVNRALEQCLHVALVESPLSVVTPNSRRLHTLTTAITGAAGGFFGLAGLAVELPVTTTIMLHSIASIARQHGEDLTQPEPALAWSLGFRAESLAVEEIPTWQGIVDVARDRGASLIVLGTHRRSGLAGHLFGSVATEIMRHSDVPTLIVHEPV